VNTELDAWLQEKFSAASAVEGRPVFTPQLRISPPLAAWENEFFLRGLNENLFTIDERGQVESEFLTAARDADAAPRNYRIFSHEPLRLLRENVCQLACAGRLIFERGWLRSHISLEPGNDAHRTTADQFDLLVRSATGEIFIWVEVRRTAFELYKLIADLRACSRRGPHALADCGFPQNHPRHEFCMATKPMSLWAVAPDGEIIANVKCEGPSLELEPLSTLPPRSLFELG
jgi:hypothetical protein